ncbi:hypothetical protein CHS0354_033897 [Potamilus streckersoni]|uniref:Adenine phosphoribosyltransferase n=1 Tax=Potamilus streckersoni TaxID=2493646 RepID=A0AAE0RWU1_9BIVA|nr:hypothetical protein CHS0354_033897 [Potamilus streckersoni]
MCSEDRRIARVKELIKDYPDFPKPGILFRDIFPVLQDAKALRGLVDAIIDFIKAKCDGVEVIIGLDSRGFLFGPMISEALGISFVPIRKAGKLPGETYKVEYTLEYGTDKCEMQKESVKPGQKVVILDDLLATGGTMKAACELAEVAQAHVLCCVVVIELTDLQGRKRFKYPCHAFVQY